MSLDRMKTGVRGGKKGSVSNSSKVMKRDYSLVSPTSPESTVTLTNIKMLLQEALEPITEDLNQLKKSVEFATDQLKTVTLLGERVTELQKNNAELTNHLKDSQAQCHVLQERVIALESYSRRNNLKFSQIRGSISTLQRQNSEDCESMMIRLFQKVGISVGPSEIENAHWIGHHKLVSRPIIIRFLNHKIRQKVFNERNKFKELGVLVTEDYPTEILSRRKIFQPVIQAAYRSNGKFKVHLNMDKLILDGKSFSTDDLDKLPTEIQPGNICNITKDGKMAFFTQHSKLSNHHQCYFNHGGHTFNSVEQFYTFKKARHFKDDETADRILTKKNPVDAMRLGNKIRNFNKQQWKEVSTDYMRQGLQAKFMQNAGLASFLKGTEKMLLVEANPFDRFWGAGIGLNDSDVWIESRWKGENQLGKLLMELRETL